MSILQAMQRWQFLSTPSGWRATDEYIASNAALAVSIHALRVEGDTHKCTTPAPVVMFLSTPSGWRATGTLVVYNAVKTISIHALRVEGDQWTQKKILR